MTPKESYKAKLAEKIISGLEKRNMEGYYCPTASEAVAKALEIIPEGSEISWGGSETIKEAGLVDALKGGSYKILDRDIADTPEEREKIMQKAMFADFFLGSSNAITYDGELVNIDGMGNRVSAYIYGPKNVLLLVSLNKAVSSADDGISRVRNAAAPPNTIRLGIDTPCAHTGVCGNCLGNTICCQIVITRYSRIKGRIKVILIGEDMGF